MPWEIDEEEKLWWWLDEAEKLRWRLEEEENLRWLIEKIRSSGGSAKTKRGFGGGKKRKLFCWNSNMMWSPEALSHVGHQTAIVGASISSHGHCRAPSCFTLSFFFFFQVKTANRRDAVDVGRPAVEVGHPALNPVPYSPARPKILRVMNS